MEQSIWPGDQVKSCLSNQRTQVSVKPNIRKVELAQIYWLGNQIRVSVSLFFCALAFNWLNIMNYQNTSCNSCYLVEFFEEIDEKHHHGFSHDLFKNWATVLPCGSSGSWIVLKIISLHLCNRKQVLLQNKLLIFRRSIYVRQNYCTLDFKMKHSWKMKWRFFLLQNMIPMLDHQ